MGTLWIGQEGSNRLKLLDVDSNEDLAEIDLPGTPGQLALGANSVWVAIDDGPIVRVNARTHAVEATIDIGGQASGVAADGSSVWATHEGGGSREDREVVRIDPATNRVTSRVKVAEGNTGHTHIVVKDGNVWVLLSGEFAAVRIDGTGGRVAEHLRLGEGGGYGYGELAVTDQAVYAIDEYSNVLHTLAPAPLAIRAQTSIPKEWDGWWAADGRALYFAHVDEERVLVLNPANLAVLQELPLTGRARALELVGDRLVVAIRYGDILIFDTASGERVAHLPGNSAVSLAAE